MLYTSLILAQSSLFPDPPSGPSIIHFYCRTFPATKMDYNWEPKETFIELFQVFCRCDKMKDLHIHLRVRILLWAFSRSCGFGCLGQAERSLQFRGNVLTDRSRSAPLSPGCSMLEGTDRHQLSGASHSRLSDGLYFRACPSLHLPRWNPEFFMCLDPSCHSSIFQPGLVCTQNPGEKGKLLELGTWKLGWRAM